MDPLNLNQSMPQGSAPVPAPVSPTAVPGIPEAGAQPEISQEQMRTNLQDLMSKIENKYQDFNSQKFASSNKLQEQEGSSLRQIFDLFESAGVDPSNVEDVRAFLDKIKANNPELYQKLETLLNSILGEENVPTAEGEGEMPALGGEETMVPPMGGEPTMDNMNIANAETSENI